ncbi:LANO_0C09604g1_1 [Lachancea nothofagi CBS 11611]|uniref:ubiquitinyl hydrolase 1 n=1 Tax=Lachancea nothofagi CBS 11611 TaxID=1266666 RepID=A0A1G4JAB8_9SACH|nr:LANO_0C09604g1_1 [Lachancea nothofagi CBS 11611]
MAETATEDTYVGTVGHLIELGKTIDDVLPELDSQETQCEGAFTWHISDWNLLTQDKHASPRFKVGDFEWSVLLFPQGNHNKGVSMYLEPRPSEIKSDENTQTEKLDNADWHVCAQFAIGVSRPGEDVKCQLFNVSHHRFCATDTDWGFASFIGLDTLKKRTSSRNSGFLADNQLNVSVFVRILDDPTGVMWHNFLNYDSKKLTGYIGFKNQGATCYLNSLLQSYFFTKIFRKVVYKIPSDKESPNDSVSLALQRSFFLLQKSQEPLDTLELTRSFGWDTGDAFTQHDVQELNRILMDRLETRMKGTEVEGVLSELFVGKMKSYIRCVNVKYESSRVEDFWDIQLNVKNLKGVQQSFENYVEVEMMDGENQYAAQDYGLQDAKKGVVFESYPPVLHLQLKRFEYDFNYDQLVKINDRYEYPETIDLAPYLDPEIKKQGSIPCKYNLHCVLVHSGDISVGHYYAMIKPSTKDQWFRFDDDKVWRVTKKQAFDENFGHESLPDEKLRTLTREQYQNYLIARQTSAYMLVYIREDMEDKVLEDVSDVDVPVHIVTSIEKELQEREKRRKELEEMHLFTKVHIHSMSNFVNYQGFDLSPNERSKLFSSELHGQGEYSKSLRVLKSTKLRDVKNEISKKMSLPRSCSINYWIMSYRKNYTLRLESILSPDLDNLPLEQVIHKLGISRAGSIDIFVEEPYLELNFLNEIVTSKTVPFSRLTSETICELRAAASEGNLPDSSTSLRSLDDDSHTVLVFLKAYNSDKCRLEGFGHVVVKQIDQISKVSGILRSLCSINQEYSFFEEFQPDTIEAVDEKMQFITSELVDGDILAFSICNPKESDNSISILSHYDFLRYRINIALTRTANTEEEYAVVKDDNDVDQLSIWISAKASYQDLVNMIAAGTKLNPSNIRTFAVYANGRFALKSDCLISDFLVKNYTRDSIPPFEFEVLSIPLKEFEHLRSIKFYWLSDSYVHYQPYEFRVPNSCTISEFMGKLQKRLGFDEEQAKSVLLWTNCDFKFQGILSKENVFEELAESFLFFGRILPDELALVNQLEEVSLENLDSMDEAEEDGLDQLNNKANVINGKLVIVIQYFKDLENRHGISFLFNLIPGENCLETRDRLHAKFGLGRKEFSKIKLGITISSDNGLTFKSLHGYTDEELREIVLFDVLNNLDYICMDHPDRTRTQTYHDRPMVIKN